MPTYSYRCTKCAHIADLFHSMSATPKVKCEKCGARCERLIGIGAGIIFKGSGFYETDFKDKKGKAPDKESKPHAAAGDGKAESKGDAAVAKAEKKSDKKAEKKAV